MHLTGEPSRPRRQPSAAHRLLRRLSPLQAIAVLIATLAITFVVDRATASAPLQHLYYVPIIIGAIALGWRGGVSAAAAAIVLYHCANPALLTFRYEETDVVQMALFLAVALVAARLTTDAARLHALAMTDDLTGLHNLRSFEARLSELIPRARLAAAPLSLLVLDVDRLKSLNDAHGHLAGAEAVQVVGHTIAACLPAEAIGCRYGGDEFVVALPRCSEPDARRVADRIRRSVQALQPVLAGIPFPRATLSVSVGVACRAFGRDEVLTPDGQVGERLFRDADRMLYLAKSRGRNRVDVASAAC
jgi:diguanylate cyclase (GGDEF)-like protein